MVKNKIFIVKFCISLQNITFAGYLEENAILLLSQGGAFAHFGFLQLFQKNKNDKCPTKTRGWMGTLGIDWALTLFDLLPSSLATATLHLPFFKVLVNSVPCKRLSLRRPLGSCPLACTSASGKTGDGSSVALQRYRSDVLLSFFWVSLFVLP